MADTRYDDRLFGAYGQRTAIGTTELNVMLIRNPSGSTRTVNIKKLIYNNSHTVSSQLRIRVYVAPTVTGTGTGVTEVALDVGSGNTASAEIYTSPTTSANGTQILDLMTLGGAAAQDKAIDFPDGFQLRPNSDLLITAVSDGTGRIANVSIVWEE